MFRKSLKVLTTVAALSAPFVAQAEPAPVARPVAPHPHPGPELGGIVMAAALVVFAGLLIQGR